MYNKIVNPNTGRRVSIYGKLGKKILNNYIKNLKFGGAQAQYDPNGPPPPMRRARGQYAIDRDARIRAQQALQAQQAENGLESDNDSDTELESDNDSDTELESDSE